MRKFYKRIPALLLAAVMLLPLTSCKTDAKKEETVGIQIQENLPYSAETLAYAEETVYALVTEIYRKAVFDNVSEKMEKRLADYARRICQITASSPVSENRYRWAIGQLSRQGASVTDELLALRKGTSKSIENTRRLYLDLSSVFGADHVASMLYDGCLLIYDARYERTIEKLETYQYPWYREEADALAAEKNTFLSSVKREDFSALIRCVTAMTELLSMDKETSADTFSDAELLELLGYLDVSEISIGAEGWEILLSYIIPTSTDSYHGKLGNAFRESGDLNRVAGVMGDALALCVNAMERLTAEDIALLRDGNREAVIASVFSRFNQTDWKKFETVTSLALSNQAYSELAQAEYGSDYTDYLESIRPTELSELRANVLHEDFDLYLSDYLAAICPSVFYEVKR